MATVADVYIALNKIAPFSTQCEWDNAGLLVGDASAPVKKLLLTLDVTTAAAAKARELGAQLIVSHHPVIFSGEKKFIAGMPAFQCAAHGIAVISCHTNLDAAPLGVNRALANCLGLVECVPLTEDIQRDPNPIGLTGQLPTPMAAMELAWYAKAKLGTAVRFTPGDGFPIARVAVCGGAGGSMIAAAKATGAQALLTGEAKHHELLEGQRLGLCMIEAGHYATEVVALPALAEQLRAALPDTEIVISDEVEIEYV